MVLTHALQDAGRERQQKEAAAVASYLSDYAKGFDAYLQYVLSTTNVKGIRLQPYWFSRDIDHFLWLPSYRPKNLPGISIIRFSTPYPGEGDPIGILALNFDESKEYVLPLLRAHLEAYASTQTKVLTGDIKGWLIQNFGQLPPQLSEADYIFFTAPFAGINPKIQRRIYRAGWPNIPMATDLTFSSKLQVCSTMIAIASDGSGCMRVATIEANHVETSPLFTFSLKAISVDTKEIKDHDTWVPNWPFPRASSLNTNTFETTDLNTSAIVTPEAALETLSTQRLWIASEPPTDGFQYTTSFDTLSVYRLQTPLAAATGLITLPTTTAIKEASADFLERRTQGILPRLSFGNLTIGTASAKNANLQSLTVQDKCTGCP